MSELTRRIAFALVAAPLAVAIVYYGDAPLAALLSLIAGLGAWELYRIASASGVRPFAPAGIALAALVPLAVHAYRIELFSAPLELLVLVPLALLAAAIWLRGVDGRPLNAVAITLFGALYTGGTLGFGYGLRYFHYADPTDRAAGTAVVVLPLLLTWASDVGGYAFGRLFGRHKLIPAVSPGKTIEGSLGAIVTSVLIAWLYARWVLHPSAHLTFTPAGLLLFAVAMSVVAQIGDLAESLLKREAGVKDSSHIIPGHGGVLDRFDSLFFVMPTAYPLLYWLLVPAPV